MSNLECFQNLIYTEDTDIVFVNETRLSKNINSSEILHSGYTIFRNDRKGRGGGVLLGIKSCLFKSIRQIKHKYDLEIVLAEITTLSDTKVLFCSCYRPPDSENIWMTQFENFLEDVCSRHSKVVLAGDFNLPRACWKNTHGNSLSGCEKEFITILNDFFLEQINTFPTRENNILDLVLTNVPQKINITEILKPTDAGIFTDHSVVMFDLTTSFKPLPRVIRYIFDYSRADFDGL